MRLLLLTSEVWFTREQPFYFPDFQPVIFKFQRIYRILLTGKTHPMKIIFADCSLPTGSHSWNQLWWRKQISTAYWIMWKCLVKEMEIPLQICEAFVSLDFVTPSLGSCQAPWLPFFEISFLFLSGFNFMCSSSFSKENVKNYQRDLDEVFFLGKSSRSCSPTVTTYPEFEDGLVRTIFFLGTFGILWAFTQFLKMI